MVIRWLPVLVLVGACTEQDAPAVRRDAGPKAVWREVKTPVPMGKKLPCDQVFGDAAKVGAALGRDIEVKDNPGSDADAAAVCKWLIPKAGAPASMPAVKAPAKAPAKPAPKPAQAPVADATGLLPGEELCTVTAYCWWLVNPGELKKRCETNGEQTSGDLGDLTCVRKVSAGETAFRYDITVLDSDSHCKLLIHSGPNLRDLPATMTCAKAAADLITRESLAGAPASQP